MANERTLLSYIRTALGLIALGVSAVWWLEGPVIQAWGSVSIVGGVVCMGIGIRRFLVTKARIRHQPE
jgi:putative membrane protein